MEIQIFLQPQAEDWKTRTDRPGESHILLSRHSGYQLEDSVLFKNTDTGYFKFKLAQILTGGPFKLADMAFPQAQAAGGAVTVSLRQSRYPVSSS